MAKSIKNHDKKDRLSLYTCILLDSVTIAAGVFAIILGIKAIVFVREADKEHEKNAKERAEAFDRIDLTMENIDKTLDRIEPTVENIEKTQERITEKCAQIQFNNEDKADSIANKIIRNKVAKSRD